MELFLQSFLFLLNITNVILHSVGAYALISVYSTCRHKPQRMYIINLAICEGIINAIEIVRSVADFASELYEWKEICTLVRHYALIISFTGISFVYYLGMMYLTVDRLAKIVLSLKYPQYWDEHKTKYLVLATWMFGITVSVGVLMACEYAEFQWESFFFQYIYLPLEISFIFIAIATYTLIFRKFANSTRKLSNISAMGLPMIIKNKTKFAEFRKSFFFIPVVLILIYVTFMIIPDLTYLCVGVIQNNPSNTLRYACWISYGTSNFLDAIIYIFFLEDVRKHLREKLTCCLSRQEHLDIDMRPVGGLVFKHHEINMKIINSAKSMGVKRQANEV